MRIEVREESIDLVEYARIPIAFEVERVLDVAGNAEEGFAVTERRLESGPTSKATMRSLGKVHNSGPNVSISPTGDSLQPALKAER